MVKRLPSSPNSEMGRSASCFPPGMQRYISLTNVAEASGTNIYLQYAELLNQNSQHQQLRGTNVDTSSLRFANQKDTNVILNTTSGQIYQPHFTYHGFRFVEVDAPEDIPLSVNSLLGCVIRSQVPETGAFACSHQGINQLMTNISSTLKANLYGVETDCPQRDERQGWLGDSDAFSQTACFAMDMSAFYTKCIRDVRDDQNPET